MGISMETATEEQREAMVNALTDEGDAYRSRAEACKAAGETEEAEKYASRGKQTDEQIKLWRASGGKKSRQTRQRGAAASTRDAGAGDDAGAED